MGLARAVHTTAPQEPGDGTGDLADLLRRRGATVFPEIGTMRSGSVWLWGGVMTTGDGSGGGGGRRVPPAALMPSISAFESRCSMNFDVFLRRGGRGRGVAIDASWADHG
jgi:hypothetical protein